LRPRVDLRLISASLQQLSATPYFDARLHRYSESLRNAIEFSLKASPSLPEASLAALTRAVWAAHQYLAGSISREAPYEVKLCLSKALDDWVHKDCLITTALVDEALGFHFLQADPWSLLKNAVPGFPIGSFDPILVLIGVPKLYKNKPLFCIPLYHELGHFVDFHYGVSDFMVLSNPPPAGIHPTTWRSHWSEYFADLFAACYVGAASAEVLESIAPNAGHSATHPGTADRANLVRVFLAGGADSRINAFRDALAFLGAPPLLVRYTVPSVTDDFDDIRPYSVSSVPELHGLFAAGWTYFGQSLARGGFPWTTSALREDEIEKTINDLVEKSIRTFSVREMWDRAASHS
jgi:hypothetical protein